MRHGDTYTVKTGGIPAKPKPETPRRRFYFWEQVEKSSGCWVYTGYLNDGYGYHGGKLAHRLSYEELVGPIPEGLEIDHLCRNPPCVNPAHLEPVTRAENIRRRFALITHCKNGHEFTTENTRIVGVTQRKCRACAAAASARYMARKKAKAA